MQIPIFEGTKKLNVEFAETDYGWIYLTLTIGENSYQTRFSEVFDPLPRFKYWLEAISVGVQQCSFSFDPEGDEIKFDFESIAWNRKLFTVSYAYGEINEFFLSDYIDRKHLVETFYCGFRDFCNSPNFNKYNWERISCAEYLIEWLESDYQTIVIGLLQFSKEELDKWFSKVEMLPRKTLFSEAEKIEHSNELKLQAEKWKNNAPPEILKIFNDEKSTNFAERHICNIQVGEITDNSNFDLDNEFQVVEINNYDRIPISYDNWSFVEKKKFIEDYLSSNCSDFDGTKIADFKSTIIEDYLNRKTS